MKLNVDASFDHDLLRGTMGAVQRDIKVGSSLEKMLRLIGVDVPMVEAVALKVGLSLA